jgi:nucleoside diphosphate kinase
MVKPDGVQRALVGEIIKRFEQKGFKLVAMKFVHVGICRIIYGMPKIGLMACS